MPTPLDHDRVISEVGGAKQRGGHQSHGTSTSDLGGRRRGRIVVPPAPPASRPPEPLLRNSCLEWAWTTAWLQRWALWSFRFSLTGRSISETIPATSPQVQRIRCPSWLHHPRRCSPQFDGSDLAQRQVHRCGRTPPPNMVAMAAVYWNGVFSDKGIFDDRI